MKVRVYVLFAVLITGWFLGSCKSLLEEPAPSTNEPPVAVDDTVTHIRPLPSSTQTSPPLFFLQGLAINHELS